MKYKTTKVEFIFIVAGSLHLARHLLIDKKAIHVSSLELILVKNK